MGFGPVAKAATKKMADHYKDKMMSRVKNPGGSGGGSGQEALKSAGDAVKFDEPKVGSKNRGSKY